MTTPVGLPEVDSIATYGGVFVDEAAVVDATTDQSATQANLIGMNVAGMTETACRAWRSALGVTSGTPGDPSNAHGAVWGHDNSVKPTVSRTSTGIYVYTWPTSITDALGVTHTVNIRRIVNAIVESTTLFHTRPVITSANVITVNVYNSSSGLNDPVGSPITVFWL